MVIRHDKELFEILEKYAREVIEESIRKKWNLVSYSNEGFQDRMILLKLWG